MTVAVAAGSWKAEAGPAVPPLSAVGDFRRGSGEPQLPQVREAELRVRAAWSSGSRAEVLWTRSARARGTVCWQWPPGKVAKVRREALGWDAEFVGRSASRSRR